MSVGECDAAPARARSGQWTGDQSPSWECDRPWETRGWTYCPVATTGHKDKFSMPLYTNFRLVEDCFTKISGQYCPREYATADR